MRKTPMTVALVVAAMLAACGSGDTPTEPTADPVTTSSGVDPATTPEPTGTGQASDPTGTGDASEPAATGEPITIGTIVFQSGVYQLLGDDVIAGMQLALDEAGGDAAGRPIEMVIEDETGDPNTAAEKTRAFIDDGVDFIVGYISTGSAYAVRDIIDAAGVPTIVANAGGNALTTEQASDSIYRVSFTTDQVTEPFGPWVYDNVGQTAAIVAADYGFGQESAAAFTRTFEEAGGTVTSTHLPELGAEDYSSYITQIAGEQPDTVFTFLSGTDAVLFLQQYAQAGLKDTIPLTTTFMVTEEALGEVGEAALGIRSSLHWARSLDNPTNQEFVAAFEEANGRSATAYAVQGYDAMQAIIAAVEETGGDTAPEAVTAALSAVRLDSPRGEIYFDENNQVIQHIYVREVQEVDGEIHNVHIEDLGVFDGAGDPVE